MQDAIIAEVNQYTALKENDKNSTEFALSVNNLRIAFSDICDDRAISWTKILEMDIDKITKAITEAIADVPVDEEVTFDEIEIFE
jgi:hypothetical protein